MISARSLNYLTKKSSLLSLGMLFVLSFTQLGCTSQTPKPATQLDPQLTQVGKIIDFGFR
ncbi:Uncharacterised protein [Providencia alcalifaciens]|nr:Uncharacterised protein [Providencia alcalifaciens]